jgi:fructoselysine transporter
MVLGGLIAIATGIVVYFIKAKVNTEWPFKSKQPAITNS